MTTEIKGRFLATESPHMPTGNPGASARDAGDRVVEIVTAMLMLDELLDTDMPRLPDYPRELVPRMKGGQIRMPNRSK